MIVLEIPFPSNKLSPNARLHWRVVAAAKKKYRADAYVVALAGKRAQLSEGEPWPPARVKVNMIFHPKGSYRYDKDGLISRMKAALDGIADALGIDDSLFDIGPVDIGGKSTNGLVRVYMSAAEE